MRLDLHGSRLIEAEVEGSLFCLKSSWASLEKDLVDLY